MKSYHQFEKEVNLIICTDFKEGIPYYYLRITTDNSFGVSFKDQFETKKEVEEYRDKVAGILNLVEINE